LFEWMETGSRELAVSMLKEENFQGTYIYFWFACSIFCVRAGISLSIMYIEMLNDGSFFPAQIFRRSARKLGR
jgi:hypothetical protein